MLNELFRTYKKIIFVVLILVCAIVFWFFGCRREQTVGGPDSVVWEKRPYEHGGYHYVYQIDDLSGRVTFGLKGYTVKGDSIPVNVHMSCSSGDFSGLVKITVPGSSGGGVSYQSAIQCVKDQDSGVTLSIPQLGNASYFCFEILDQYGNTLLSKMEIPAYSEWIDPESQANGQICIGLLTNQYSSFSFLDNLLIETDSDLIKVRIIDIAEGGFPGNRDSINMLSGIVIDDYAVENMDKEQEVALKNWIKNGGKLIVATGEHGEKDLAGLSDVFRMKSGNLVTERMYFGASTGFTGELSLYLDSLTFENNAGWKMVSWSDPASLYERSYGKGSVYALRFSFTDESILQWNRLNDMAKSLFKYVFDSIIEGNADEENGLWSMELALNSFNRSQTPNAFYYGVFFLAYLCTLTFLAYYLLSRIKKREYIWAVVPSVAILFTLCIIFRSRGTPSQAQSSFSSIRVVDDSDPKNDIYFLYQNAEGERMNMSLMSAVDQVVPMDFEYAQEPTDYTQLTTIQEEYTISNTIKGYDVSFSEATPGTVRMLKMKENRSMNYGEKSKMFSSGITGDHTSFSGQITNISTKDFDKLVVIRGNEYWTTSGLKGQSSLSIDPKEIKAWSPGSDEYVLSSEEDDALIQDVLDYVVYRCLKNNGNLGDLIVVGLTRNDRYQLFRATDASVGNQVSVYINHFNLDLPEKMEYQVDINREFLENNLTYDDLLTQASENEKIETEYRFDPNKLMWAMARCHDDYTGKIYAYRLSTKEWEEILPGTDDQMGIEDLEPYLSEMNIMRIKYEQSEDAENYNLPILSVWMKKTVFKE